MELLMELGDFGGMLSLVVILLSALAIPGGVIWALLHQVKGPIERAREPAAQAPEHHSEWRDQRYAGH